MAVNKKTAKPKAAAKKKPATKKPVTKKTASKSSPTKKKKTSTKPVKKTAPVKKKAAATGKSIQKRKTASAKATRPAPARNTGKVGPVPGIAPYQEAKGEEYMNEKQVAHFRNILLTWKKELMEEVDRTVHHMQDDAANFPDPNDRATQESEFSMELRARDRERKLIKKIDEALAHLDDKEYGYCEACGVEIGVKRLEARPTATLCIDCKILDEIREKQMG
jgi:DnaK suppressor protein